jgi:hypothetical protein
MRLMRLFAAGTLVVAACSTFGSSEATDGPTDGGASSGSSSSGSSSGGAARDGATPDAADATKPGERFCNSPAAAGATYCADFEDGAAPLDWPVDEKGMAELTVVNADARSGTYAITTAGMAASSDVGAALTHAIGPRPTALVLAAGVRINAIANGNTNVFTVEMKSDAYVYYALEIEVQDDGTGVLREHRFSSGAPDYDIANKWDFSEKVPSKKWVELSLVLTMTGGTSTASVILDGKTVATGAPTAHQMTEVTGVVFGEPHADANVSWSTSFDDVRITITP